ncbi:hypothetical protein BG005_010194 [Podila minutissima]|nr:hypothetical protein BG005_010194 [Podila minutissima]
MPTLLMRRYRRGVAVSSCSIESFITMPSDKDLFHSIQESWSLLEPVDIIVLDQDMSAGPEEYGRSATAAWTLVNVLEQGAGIQFQQQQVRLWYLEGGFEAIQTWDAGEKFLGATATTANKPLRRESLFSLNTKVVRPPGLSRSQTVGSASAPHLKPLMIPPPINTSSQPQQKSWLTVPTSTPAPSLSPVMSMEMNLPASTDHAFASTPSTWSANSTNGSGHFNVPQLSLKSKRSFSSINTTATSIREEGDESETDLSSFSPDSQRQTKGDFHREYESRMFNSEGSTFQYYNNDTHHHDCSMDYDQEEEDENKGEQEISCILPGFLYLGPEIVTEAQVQELQSLGVKRVLNMAQECEDKVLVCKDQFEYHKIGVHDHVEADVSAGLLKAVEIIASSTESPIYVHCKAGKSRSVTATIAYLIMHLHWPLNKAYQHVLTQRPCMCPNIGFVTELMKVEKQTFGAEATGLHMRA